MNYEIEIIKLLMESASLREDYPRICAVAQAVSDGGENYYPYLWAYVSGQQDWKKVEKTLP